MDITRNEANRQLEAMLLIEEPWTPEQCQEAERLQRLSWGPGVICLDDRLWRRRMDALWCAHQRQQQAFAADIKAMPAMSLDDFKRELAA